MSYGRPIDVQPNRAFARQAHSPQMEYRSPPVVAPRQAGKIEIRPAAAQQKSFQVTFNSQHGGGGGIRIEKPNASGQGQPTQFVHIPPRPASTSAPINIQVHPVAPAVQQAPVTTPPPAPQQPQMSRFSLLSFVSSFEEGKSFNETDLASLGLDLQCDKPLLPMLHSVLSDVPLLDKSCLPVPECYTKIEAAGDPREQIGLFSEQTLMFIFATQTKTPLQAQAAEELQKRGFSYDADSETWHMPNGNEWSVNEWREIESSTHKVTE